MKEISIVGMGLGADTMTLEAKDAITRADVILGAPRMLELCSDMQKTCCSVYLPDDVAAVVAQNDAQTFTVLVSGDVGFYSAAAGLNKALNAYDIRFIPGVSTVSAFFAKLRLLWQDTAFVSAHGRESNIVDTVRRNRLTFCLTGNNVDEIGAALKKAGLGDVLTHVGENLGTEQERIYATAAESLGNCPSLTVLLFVNDAYDGRIPCGLPDHCFARLEKTPMTKSETRAIIMSKLGLNPTDICWDIGAGTGSVTVEMALSAYRGHVYAVERREEAISLIMQNCTAFHIGNITAVCKEAPGALDTLPAPDAVFIGGSGGELPEIINMVLRKNPLACIVITAVTLETVQTALTAFKDAKLEPEIVQISTARAKKVGELHLMEAQNPVTILVAGGKP